MNRWTIQTFGFLTVLLFMALMCICISTLRHHLFQHLVVISSPTRHWLNRQWCIRYRNNSESQVILKMQHILRIRHLVHYSLCFVLDSNLSVLLLSVNTFRWLTSTHHKIIMIDNVIAKQSKARSLWLFMGYDIDTWHQLQLLTHWGRDKMVIFQMHFLEWKY